MADALMHPDHGYYATRDPFGRDGDFVTAPEISQMFGELIGLWAAVVWQNLGAPGTIHLVELGPGRGTLMSDALRAARQMPGFRESLTPHLVEMSPVLRARQQQRLAGEAAVWHTDLATVPDGPAIVIANEFFDALPIAQLVRDGGLWRERRVALDPDSGGLVWTLTPGPSPHAALLAPDVARAAPDDAVAEVSPPSLGVARSIADRVMASGGAALVIDYGHEASAAGDSLQAVKDHAYADVLGTLGEADLTAHVDFAALARVVTEAGAVAHGPVDQGVFLRRLGIEARAERLMRDADTATRGDVRAALRRLIEPGEMGTLFKVVAWTAPGDPVPPGLEPRS
ncbi:MAG: SAM-dependent methyltransferase [Alphaproteobacteria bacterium]|nr:SAM-dependent methyltransferase [Alphaproteobacteria bacterium]